MQEHSHFVLHNIEAEGHIGFHNTLEQAAVAADKCWLRNKQQAVVVAPQLTAKLELAVLQQSVD